MATDYCTYPNCKCIVSTSTTQPEPQCPLGLERAPTDEYKCAAGSRIERDGQCPNCGAVLGEPCLNNVRRNPRSYRMSAQERCSFDPAKLSERMINAGIVFDSVGCPFKIKKPWDCLPTTDGGFLYRQWDEVAP